VQSVSKAFFLLSPGGRQARLNLWLREIAYPTISDFVNPYFLGHTLLLGQPNDSFFVPLRKTQSGCAMLIGRAPATELTPDQLSARFAARRSRSPASGEIDLRGAASGFDIDQRSKLPSALAHAGVDNPA
jgi:hypothetical protein